MKFKDVYKSANNRVSADKEILNTLFEKEDKKSWYGYVPVSLASFAAVAFVFAVIFMNSTVPTDTQTNNIVLQKQITDQQNPDGNSNNNTNGDTTDKLRTNDVNKKNDEDAYVSKPSQDNSGSSDSDIPVIEEDEFASDEFAAKASIEEGDFDAGDNSAYKGSLASGGGAAFRLAKEEASIISKSLTCEEYFEYIGFSIKNDETLFSNDIFISFPDMYHITKNEIDGDIIDDSVSFTFYSQMHPEFSAILMLGKANSPQIDIGDLYNVSGCEVYIQELDNIISARFLVGDAWFVLTSTGIQQHEVVSLLSELLTNKIY